MGVCAQTPGATRSPTVRDQLEAGPHSTRRAINPATRQDHVILEMTRLACRVHMLLLDILAGLRMAKLSYNTGDTQVWYNIEHNVAQISQGSPCLGSTAPTKKLW